MFLALPVVSVKRKSDPISVARKLVGDGRFSLACRALADEESMAPLDENTFTKLRDKHPVGIPIPMPEDGLPKSIFMSAGDIKSAMDSFSKGSAGGLSKLTPDHIRSAASIFCHSSVYESILYVCRLFSNGSVLREAQPYVCGAFLSALLKKCGGIRPIACGDVFRRLTGKVIISLSKEKARISSIPFNKVSQLLKVLKLSFILGGSAS